MFTEYEPFTDAGRPHPSPLRIASVASYAPRVVENASLLHPEIRANAALSNAQLDAVSMTRAKHESDRAFLIADGTGAGKGREAVAVIMNSFLLDGDKKPRALFVSVANVFSDLERDCLALGFDRDLVDARSGAKMPKTGIVFVPYSSLGTRFQALNNWLLGCKSPVVVLDECHSAKNLVGQGASQVARTVQKLIALFPKRLLLMSATPVSCLADAEYLARPLGLVGTGAPFPDFETLKESFGPANKASSVLELIQNELAAAHSLVARQLGFDGVTSRTISVPLADADKSSMHESWLLWRDLLAIGWSGKHELSQVFGAALRFGKARLLLTKIEATVQAAEEALRAGRQVVISLQGTGEAAARRAACEDDENAASAGLCDTLNQVIQLAEARNLITDQDARIFRSRAASLGLPEASPLSILKQRLGGTKRVAELTGRSAFYSKDEETGVWMQETRKLDVTAERRCFQRGKKLVALLSAACGTGTSLHAEGKAARPRTLVVFELPWGSTQALQAFGRVHRSGAVHPPEYIVIASAHGPDRRFAATVASRLASLGAGAAGDRDASGVASKLRIDDDSTSSADTIVGFSNHAATFVERQCDALGLRPLLTELLITDKTTGKSFLNRLLILSPDLGQRVFNLFADAAVEAQLEAERKGSLTEPILSIGNDAVFAGEEKIGDVVVVGLWRDLGISHEKILQKREDLILSGSDEQDVYFVAGPALHWRRTSTTAIEWYPSGVRTIQTKLREHPAAVEPNERDWCENFNSVKHARGKTYYVAKLPALSALRFTRRASPRLAKVQTGDRRFIGLLLLSEDVIRLRRAAASKQAAEKEAAFRRKIEALMSWEEIDDLSVAELKAALAFHKVDIGLVFEKQELRDMLREAIDAALAQQAAAADAAAAAAEEQANFEFSESEDSESEDSESDCEPAKRARTNRTARNVKHAHYWRSSR
jgi:hypothetical protein